MFIVRIVVGCQIAAYGENKADYGLALLFMMRIS